MCTVGILLAIIACYYICFIIILYKLISHIQAKNVQKALRKNMVKGRYNV